MGVSRSLRWQLLFGSLLLFAVGCGHDDTERLARVGRKLSAKAETLTGSADGKLAQGWQVLHGGSEEAQLEARVTGRLRWDKSLADTEIQVHALGQSVELTGTVRDGNQRRRAVELAESTTGVAKLTDLLQDVSEEP